MDFANRENIQTGRLQEVTSMLLDLSKSMEKVLQTCGEWPVAYMQLNAAGQILPGGCACTPFGNFKSSLLWYNRLRAQYEVVRQMSGVSIPSSKPFLNHWNDAQVLGDSVVALIRNAWIIV
jgi:hypothetical protein